MKQLTFFFLLLFSTSSVFAQAFDKPFILSYSVKSNHSPKGYFLRIYKKGDSVRTLVVDSTTRIIYDAVKNLKNGETCWINHSEQTKLIVKDMHLPADSSEWKVKDLTPKIIYNCDSKGVKKKNKTHTLNIYSAGYETFNFSSLVDHLFLKPFNSIIKYRNEFKGSLTNCSIKSNEEDIEFTLCEFSFSNIPDSLFNNVNYKNFAQRVINLSNLDSGMIAFKGKFYKNEVFINDPYSTSLYFAKQKLTEAKRNETMNYLPPVATVGNTGDIKTDLQNLSKSIETSKKNIELMTNSMNAYNEYRGVQELSSSNIYVSQNPTYYTPIIILNEALAAFYTGSEQKQKLIYSALKIN